ncbi:adenylosuccinate lyase [candidate division WOR-3 bacterium JGI_Cruoil_03_51_56]|uniref:Adenylosuccinate lyase n=1 Tax=candidate division WOR-3 bacterium JGI_Cruoil_03_51_56 TaxID=1973747 RepID=A0A235BSL3_UNCW3|nr:MAG: adenylosuccinate lyase [candidate division WOR-3 bacterium JGI_Cruoil_03_51_56]
MIKRYTPPEMAALWSEQAKFNSWLLVEKAVAQAQAELGIIPKNAAKAIQQATFKISEIEKFEKKTNHDVIAFTKSVAKSIGKPGKYVHFGLTSYDIVDTALSLRCISALGIIENALRVLRIETARLALKYKHTPMIGRTHGVHAEPITFGLKCLSWYEEINRNMERLRTIVSEMHYGKISGAVGSYTQLPQRLEKRVLARLGLKPEPVSTQVIPRDRHAHMLSVLAIIAAGLERIATEIRNLQRTEIAELAEPFGSGQRGSSAMPHKKNPITCERVTSLARVIRSYALVGIENIPLWHERDLTNSAAERIIIPDATTLLHYMILKLTQVLAGLKVNPEKMMQNLETSAGAFFSQTLLLALIKAGIDRDRSYQLVQKLAFRSRETGITFPELARKDRTVLSTLGQGKLKQIFNLNRLLRNINRVYRRVGLVKHED